MRERPRRAAWDAATHAALSPAAPALLVLVIGVWFVLARSYHMLQGAVSSPLAQAQAQLPVMVTAARPSDGRLAEDVARLRAEVAARDRDVVRLMALLSQRPPQPPPPPAPGEDGYSVGAVAAVARARSFAASLAFGPRYAANPWRASLARGRIDWHDLVPLPEGAAAGAGAAAATTAGAAPAAAAASAALAADAAALLARHVREDAKARLVALLQDRDPGPPHSPPPPHASSAQERIVTVLRGDALVDDALSGGASTNATVLEALLRLLRRRSAVERAAAVVGVAPDDVSGHYGAASETGALAPLVACPLVRDKCLLHSSLRACVAESLCGWCQPRAVCLTRGMGAVQCVVTPGAGASAGGEGAGAGVGAAAAAPAAPAAALLGVGGRSGVLVVAADTVSPSSGAALPSGAFRLSRSGERVPVARGADAPNCSAVVWEHPLVLGVSGDSTMAYHLATETLPQWYTAAKAAPGVGVGGVSNLVVVRGAYSELFVFAHVFSAYCPRAAAAPEVQAACFVPGEGDTADKAVGQAGSLEQAPGRPSPRGATALALALVAADTGALVRQLTPSEAAGVLESPAAAVQAGMRLGLPAAKRVLEAVAADVAGSTAWLDAASARFGNVLPALLRREDIRTAAAQAGARIKLDYSDLAIAHCMAHGPGVESSAGGGAPPPQPPLVVLVSRLNKRLVLNEPSLVRIALALGADVRLVALEGMSLCAQVQLFASASVLVGMHGSALINAHFMARGSSLVQLVPHALTGAATFFQGPAEAHGVRYFELPAAPREASIPHGHFLRSGADVEKVLAAGAEAAGPQVYFSFFVNQDTVVDEARFADVLARALKPLVRVLPSFPPPPPAGRPGRKP